MQAWHYQTYYISRVFLANLSLTWISWWIYESKCISERYGSHRPGLGC